MKKNINYILSLLLLVIILIPQVTLASWWNPFSWNIWNIFRSPREQKVEIVIPLPTTSANETIYKTATNTKSDKTKDNKDTPVELSKKQAVNIPQKISEPKITTQQSVITIEPKTSVALSISNINIDPKTNSAYISWQTNMASESKILLNGNAYQSKNGVDALHYVEIGGLISDHSYAGTITALANNAWANQEITFFTKQAPQAPIIIKKEVGKLTFVSGGPNSGSINQTAEGAINQILWEAVASVSVKDLEITSLKLRNVGSSPASIFTNLKIYINGNFVSSGSSVDANGYVNFDFSAVKLSVGNISFRMTGDIKGGSSRTVQFSLRNSSDINVVEIDTKDRITPSGMPVSGSVGILTIEPGRLTITKSTNSPSGTISAGASDIVLARYKLEAFNEEMRVGTLRVTLKTNNDNLGSLRNVTLYSNGVKISYSLTLKKESINNPYLETGAVLAPLKLLPGESVILEVRGDIYDNDGTNDVASGDTIQIILLPGSYNVQSMESLSSSSVPTGQLPGNILTVVDDGNL